MKLPYRFTWLEQKYAKLVALKGVLVFVLWIYVIITVYQVYQLHNIYIHNQYWKYFGYCFIDSFLSTTHFSLTIHFKTNLQVINSNNKPDNRWKCKIRVTRCESRLQIFELQSQIYELQVQIHKLRVQIHKLRD